MATIVGTRKQEPAPPSACENNSAQHEGVDSATFGTVAFEFVLLVVCDDFPVIRGWGWYLRDADSCPAICCPFLQYVILP